jgi:predicted ATPase
MLLESIKLTNLLSFREAELELRALNVLIGPNASGKSNLIAAMGLLKAAPENLEAAVIRGGGVRQWIHKSPQQAYAASIDARLQLGQLGIPVSYSLTLAGQDAGYFLGESLRGGDIEREYFHRVGASVKIFRAQEGGPVETGIEDRKSVFAAFRDPLDRTPITQTGQALGAIEIFREFNTGPVSNAKTALPSDTKSVSWTMAAAIWPWCCRNSIFASRWLG